MSQVIDTKVVEMQFDNSKFEKNVEVSLNTLKNLNKSIDDAGKNRGSLDELAHAGDQVGISFDNMNMKSRISLNMFDMIAGVGTKAFNRISDAVAGFALNMANSLSGMQAMRDGFNEYELKMGSVQTILMGAKIIDPKTGQNLEDTSARLDVVNQKLEELNLYSDKTIYSFKDMTSNIGKFTNAGVNLDDAVGAIQGVANVAAVSGANAQDASRAMYNFSQALSSGAVKLIDWKSIENANMATVEFKQQLLDTAVAMGTVVKEGDMYKTTTTDAQGKVSDLFNATTKFNDALSNQWMTTDVLTQTLKNYSTDVNEMSKEEVAAYKEKLKSIGYTEEQAEGIVKLSKKAFAAATEVKTFSQMIDTLKESLGSGWAQSFEIIFGNFEEAKALWTGLNNAIDGMLSPIAKTRNAILQMWKDNGGRDAIIQSFRNLYQAIQNLFAPIKELWKALTPNTEHSGKILASISKGIERLTAVVAKGAAVIGKVLATLLKPVIFFGNFVGKGLIKLVGIVQSAFTKISSIVSPIGKSIKSFADRMSEAFNEKIVSRITSFQTSFAKAFNKLKDHVKSSSALQKLIAAFENLRKLIQDLFGRVIKTASIYIEKFIGYLGKLWKAIAPLVSSAVTKVLTGLADFILPKLEKALTWVSNRLQDIGRLVGKIDIKNSKLYRGLAELPERIKSLSNNKAIKSISTTIKNFGSEALTFLINKFKALRANLEAIKMPKGLSDVFSNIKNFIKSIFGADSVAEKVNETTKALAGVGETSESGQKLTAFQKFLEGLSNAFEWLKNSVTKAKEVLEDFIRFVITNTPKALRAIYNFIAGPDGMLTMSDIVDVVYAVSDAMSTLMFSFGVFDIGRAANAIGGSLDGLTETFSVFLKKVANKFQMNAIKDFAIAMAILAGSLFLIAQIPAGKLVAATVAMGVLGTGLYKFFNLMSSGDFRKEKIAGNLSIAALLLAIGASMIGVAASVGILVAALAVFPKVIKAYNNLGNEFRTGMERVKEVLAEIFEYLDHTISAKYGFRSAVALLGLVASLDMIRKTIVKFANKKTGEAMAEGLDRIKQVLEILGDFLNSTAIASFNGINIGVNLNTVGMAAMIWALGDMMGKILPAIQGLSKLSPQEFKTAFHALDTIFFEFAAFLGTMSIVSKFAGASLGQWAGISLTIGVISSAISTCVTNLSTLADLASKDPKSLKTALMTLSELFLELNITLAIVGLLKPESVVGTLFGLSMAIGVMTACVVALVPIANSHPEELRTSVLALGGLMLALGGALALASLATKKTSLMDVVQLIAMAGAMVMITQALRRMARIDDPESISAAGKAIAVAALSMAGAVAIINAVSVSPICLAALGLLAVIVWGVVAAIVAFRNSAGGMAEGAKQVEDSSKQMGDAVASNVGNIANSMKETMPDLFSSIFENIGPKIQEALKNFHLGEYLRTKLDEVKADAVNWAQDWIDVGVNIISGLSTAISDPGNVEKVKAGMVQLGKALLESFMLFLGIHSPSTVMMQQGGYVIDGLVQGLMQYPEKLAGWASGIGSFIVEKISGLVTGALEKGGELVQKLGEGIQNGKDYAVTKASELGQKVLDGLGKASDWASSAGAAITAFGERLQNGKGPISKAAGVMISGVSSAVSKINSALRSAASSAVSKFKAELKAGAGPVKAAALALIAGAKAAFKGIGGAFRTFGTNAAEGFRNGINSMISKIAEKAREMVRRAKEAAKSEQHSNSPSKDFMEYGGWAGQGYALGLSNRKVTRLIEKNASKMVDAAKNAVSSSSFGVGSLDIDSNPAVQSLAQIMNQISGDLEDTSSLNPTIRPVIDMSDVNRSESIIDAMFGNRQISASLSAAAQIAQSGFDTARANRADLLSFASINKLAKTLDSMTESMNSRALNNYITIDGSSDPEGFANDLIRSFQLNARTV